MADDLAKNPEAPVKREPGLKGLVENSAQRHGKQQNGRSHALKTPIPKKMIRPVTIVHNSVSLDGSVVGFEVDMVTHYRTAGRFKAQAHLVGSGTAIAGIKQYSGKLRRETAADRRRPKKNDLPPWVVVDSKARLYGKLHAFRGSGFGDDPIVLVSEKTPRYFIEYLVSREYRYHIVGHRQVNLTSALQLLAQCYGVKRLLVDAGPGLVGALLKEKLVDQISLLIVPQIVGQAPLRMFDGVERNIGLQLLKQELIGRGLLWCLYQVSPTSPKSGFPRRGKK